MPPLPSPNGGRVARVVVGGDDERAVDPIRLHDDLVPFGKALGDFDHVMVILADRHLATAEAIGPGDVADVLALFDGQGLRRDHQGLVAAGGQDLYLGGHAGHQPSRDDVKLDAGLEVLDLVGLVPASLRHRQWGDRDDLPFELDVRQGLDLDPDGHPSLDPVDDRLVELHLDFHLAQVGQIEQVLVLADDRAEFDHRVVIVISVDEKAVVRSADRAVVNLLLVLSQLLVIALNLDLAVGQLARAPSSWPCMLRIVLGAVYSTRLS